MSDRTQRLVNVGLICVEWSVLEFYAAIVIWGLLDLDHDTGVIVTGGMDMLPRFNMAIALARHRKASRRLIAGLEAARKTLQDGLDVRRNRAVHGLHARKEDGSTTVTTHRGRGARIEYPITPDDYMQVADDIYAVQQALKASVKSAGLGWLETSSDRSEPQPQTPPLIEGPNQRVRKPPPQ